MPSLPAQWPNYPQDTAFFPISAFLQNPLADSVPGYSNLAKAAAACGINIMMAIDDGGTNWPSGFGTDAGQMAAMRDAGIYCIAAGHTLHLETANNTAINSVASFLALDAAQGGGRTVIGWNGGDEPSCEQAELIPAAAANVAIYDPTRPYFYNQFAGAALQPGFNPCQAVVLAGIRATSAASFDLYPFMNPYFPCAGSDFLSVPKDSLYAQGLAVKNMRLYCALPGQPVWAFVECGSDALRGGANDFLCDIENGSTTLTNVSNFSVFTSSWEGLTVSNAGIPGGTTIEEILSPTTARMSNAATADNAAAQVFVTGGDLNDCLESENICVVNGTVYRATPAQVTAEVWVSIINGATGIEWFLHDNTAYGYGIGAGGSAGALEAAANLTYINGVLRSYGAMLNSQTLGICSMDSIDPVTGNGSTPTVASSCSDGILTMETSNIAVPGAALLKFHNGSFYLIAQPSRRNSATMTFTIVGAAHKIVTCIYDSNAQYDAEHSCVGNTFATDGDGKFSVGMGANGNHYQTMIFQIQSSAVTSSDNVQKPVDYAMAGAQQKRPVRLSGRALAHVFNE